MERFYGFDLGDAECAISRLNKTDQDAPEILEIDGTKSFVTAYAHMKNGDLMIGEKACYTADAVTRKLRFKSRFLTDPLSEEEMKSFAAGVWGELLRLGLVIKGEDSCFYIGCPAGWNRNAREDYRSIFQQVGYPPVRVISESRAAMVSACQSRHLQVGYDILKKPVLVVDIGSSTTDFAYICGGREVEMRTAGEVALGEGVMDEILLEESISRSENGNRIRKIFAECEPWKNYCEFTARRLKEKYYSDVEYWQHNECRETVRIYYGEMAKLTIRMDAEIADRLVNKKLPKLENRSFRQVFVESLKDVRESITGDQPELLFLTGGVSKLRLIREWCREVFPEAVVITSLEPEFSVSRGLAWSGRIDEEVREFRAELQELVSSSVVEDIVRERITDLYRDAVETLVDPILTNVAAPVFEQWRNGQIRKLSDTEDIIRTRIAEYMHSEEARELLVKPITGWLKPISDALEEHTLPICVRHHVPYTALSLSSYLSASDIDLKIDTKDMFGVQEITLLIDSIISILVGLICGGSGIALVSSGIAGVLIGAAISLLVLILGKEWMEDAILKMDIPKPMRKMIPKSSFVRRMDSVSSTVKANLYESLEKEKNEEITSRLVREISTQIEMCLTKMAEVVEIPLG